MAKGEVSADSPDANRHRIAALGAVHAEGQADAFSKGVAF